MKVTEREIYDRLAKVQGKLMKAIADLESVKLTLVSQMEKKHL